MSSQPAVQTLESGYERRNVMGIWSDLAAGLSFANISYFRVWSELLTMRESDAFEMQRMPLHFHLPAVMMNVLALGALITLAIRLWRRSDQKTWASLLLVALFLLPLRSVESVYHDRLAAALPIEFVFAGVLGILCGAAFKWTAQVARGAVVLLMLFSPFVLFNFLHAGSKLARMNPASDGSTPLAPLLSNNTRRADNRIIWIIYDEMSYQLSFSERPASVNLPALDRLKNEAIFATQAHSPAGGTMRAMPALTTGQFVIDATKASSDHLLLSLPGLNEPVSWGAQPTIFSAMRDAGRNTAVVGWAHPYCRVHNNSLTHCWWWEAPDQRNSMGDSFTDILLNQTRSLFETKWRSPFGQSLTTRKHARDYYAIQHKAAEIVGDPEVDFALLHLNVPHAPYFYDAATGTDDLDDRALVGLWRSAQTGYLSQLMLADRAFGELREQLLKAGLWDRTTLLISADHTFRHSSSLFGKGRKSDQRVPFILKLAGHNQPIVYERPFNTVVTKELLLSIAKNDLKTPQDVVHWLDRDNTPYKSPYYHSGLSGDVEP